ncbi:MAG: PRC-barrel domain-containing protein [Syntrophomonadaceae bacterium]
MDINPREGREEKRLLYKLSELDFFEVAKGDPDVRGWDVYGGDGVKIGEVDDLIVDPAALKVRYLDIILSLENKDDELNDRHFLIPIGLAVVDKKDDRVSVPKIRMSNIRQYPVYDGGLVTRIFENSIRKIMDPDIIYQSDDSGDFYSHRHFDEDMFYGDRRRRAGL